MDKLPYSPAFYRMPKTTDKPQAVILADGTFPWAGISRALLNKAGRVVCCDGAALNFIAQGGTPSAIVGDCDSLPGYIGKSYSGIIHCDRDQASNDLTKAVAYCISQGYSDIVILGGTGKREDHSLGNIGLLAHYRDMEGVGSIRMVTDNGVFDIISADAVFESFKGQQVSLFTPDISTSVTTGGLLYPLSNAHLTGWWQGTLNESLSDRFSLDTDGKIIVFRLFRK